MSRLDAPRGPVAVERLEALVPETRDHWSHCIAWRYTIQGPIITLARRSVVDILAAEIHVPDTARNDVVPRRGVEGDEGGARLDHAGLLPWNLIPKGYRGAAEGSSEADVPVFARPEQVQHPRRGGDELLGIDV